MRILETKYSFWLILLCLFFVTQYLLVQKKMLLRFRSELIQVKRGAEEPRILGSEVLKKNLLSNPYCGHSGSHFYFIRFLPNNKVHLWVRTSAFTDSPATLPNAISTYMIKNNELYWDHRLLGTPKTFSFKAQQLPSPDFHFLTLRNKNSFLSPRLCPN